MHQISNYVLGTSSNTWSIVRDQFGEKVYETYDSTRGPGYGSDF